MERNRQPLTARTRASIIACIVLFGVLPYTEEVLRCRKVRRSAVPLAEHNADRSLVPEERRES
jgi:hypothetical protein